MDFTEKAIEDLIYESIENDDLFKLYERGLYALGDYHKFLRQVNLGEYGRLDLVGVAYHKSDQERGSIKKLNVGIIEIKKGEVNYNTFIQAVRYCKGVEHYLNKKQKMTGIYKIILIGSSVCKSDFIYLPDFMKNLEIYTIKLDLDKGIRFNTERGYLLTKANINVPQSIEFGIKEYIKTSIRETIDLVY